MPDPLFETLFDDTDTIRWAPTDAVRARARQRNRRSRVTAAIAAVVAVGAIAGGVALAQRGQQTNPIPGATATATPTASATPTPSTPPSTPPTTPPSSPSTVEPTTTITQTMFLQPEDVGTGYRASFEETGSGDWVLGFSLAMLNCRDDTTGYVTRRDGALRRSADDHIAQYVARYQAGDGARYFDTVRTTVAACKPASGKSIKIVAEGFAGQESLMIDVDYGEGNLGRHVIVRQGDVVTTFAVWPNPSRSASQQLARKAAARLCTGTPAC
jgi:hypothetical protein